MSRPEYKKLYGSQRWKNRRAAQLRMEPLCRMCEERGQITAATVADHIEPHRGDLVKFWTGALQSACASCHSGDKQALERSGRVRQRVGLDGWPIA